MSISESGRRLASLAVGERGVVRRVLCDNPVRAERLMALGVTPGARVRLLQRFPGFVFECDQTELAIEPSVARSIVVEDGGEKTEDGRQESEFRIRNSEEARRKARAGDRRA